MKHDLHKVILSISALCLLLFLSGTGSCFEYPDTLTREEIAWLRSISNTPIRYVIPPRFAPVSFVENGKAAGIVKEYLTLLEQTLGIQFKLIDVTWKEGMELAKRGEVDLFPCLAYTSEREEVLNFVKGSYVAFPLVIVTRKDVKPIRRVEDLHNMRVAVDKTLVAYSKLINNYSHLDIDFLFVQTNPNELKAVHLSEADAALTSSAVAGYLIAENGWNNLKIAGETGWPEVQMTMGVKKDWPLFVSILEKSLAAVPDSTRTRINNRWVPINFEHSFDSVYVIKRILPFLGLIAFVTLMICLFLVVVMRKNRQLQEADQKIQNAYIEIESAWKVAQEASRAKSEFLDNSGQGFLSFGEDLMVNPEYSRECETLFGQPVGGEDISDLLFADEEPSFKKNFQRAVSLTLNEPLDLKQELYLSLLKPCYRVGDRYIKAEYRLIGDKKMMLILTDITREKRLEQDVAVERNRLKFVIAAVRESKDFFTIIEDLTSFKLETLPELLSLHHSDPKELLSEIYRSVHTFKGLFAQQEFIAYPAWLHTMESRISKMILNETLSLELIEQFLSDFKSESVLEEDLEIIREFLGEQFMERRGELLISRELASGVEWVARRILGAGLSASVELQSREDDLLPSKAKNLPIEHGDLFSELGDFFRELKDPSSELQKILTQASQIRHVNLKTLLLSHVVGVQRLSMRLGRQIAPFQVEGDDLLVDPDRFSPFIRSLVNVFRNAVDHGVETPEERVEAGKPESATISCSVKKENRDKSRAAEVTQSGGEGELSGEIVISIADDGRGVDLDTVAVKAVEKGIMTLEQVRVASEKELIDLIFFSGLTTLKRASTMSGRGMGLSAVKIELEKLNGWAEVRTEKGRGTLFSFHIPFSI